EPGIDSLKDAEPADREQVAAPPAHAPLRVIDVIRGLRQARREYEEAECRDREAQCADVLPIHESTPPNSLTAATTGRPTPTARPPSSFRADAPSPSTSSRSARDDATRAR